jgi:hypothetical protein
MALSESENITLYKAQATLGDLGVKIHEAEACGEDTHCLQVQANAIAEILFAFEEDILISEKDRRCLLNSVKGLSSSFDLPVSPVIIGIQKPLVLSGTQGPAGPAGAKGDQGDQGIQGDQGPAGPAGSKGDQGDAGPVGPQGIQGDQGIQGIQGDQGVQGPQGDQGPIGATGATGATGNTGPQGAQGPQGDTGPQGIQGPKGDVGDRYKTFATDNLTIAGAGTLSIVVETGLAYSIAQSVIVAWDASNYMNGDVTSYNPATGNLVLDLTASTGSGTFNGVWEVNLDGAAIGASLPIRTELVVTPIAATVIAWDATRFHTIDNSGDAMSTLEITGALDNGLEYSVTITTGSNSVSLVNFDSVDGTFDASLTTMTLLYQKIGNRLKGIWDETARFAGP